MTIKANFNPVAYAASASSAGFESLTSSVIESLDSADSGFCSALVSFVVLR
jgi:predicted RND superfamily exporter protein